MSKIILQQRQPQRFEGRNIRTPKRSSANADIYLLSFEVTREAWEALETIPKTGILEGVIWWSDGDPVGDEVPEEKPKKEKAPKGPYGAHWAAMWNRGVFNNWDLALSLDMNSGDFDPGAEGVKQALRATLGVKSMAEVSPERFEEWAEGKNLFSLVNLSRQCAAKVQENA
jgi:hypothetical protein